MILAINQATQLFILDTIFSRPNIIVPRLNPNLKIGELLQVLLYWPK